jgi:proteasome accessory factor A
MADGSSATALEIQWELHARSRRWAENRGLDAVGGAEVGNMILDGWEKVLDGLSTDPLALADQLDWVAKYRLFDAYRERHGIEWTDARLRAMDLQYHDMRRDSGLAGRVGLVELVDPEAVSQAMTNPPTSTRAYFRGRCLERFPDQIVAANWDSMVFDVGGSSLHRVPMMEPTRGTAEHVADLIDSAESADELLESLGR